VVLPEKRTRCCSSPASSRSNSMTQTEQLRQTRCGSPITAPNNCDQKGAPAQQLVAAILEDDRFGDHRAGRVMRLPNHLGTQPP
jgi:hypothetical protein